MKKFFLVVLIVLVGEMFLSSCSETESLPEPEGLDIQATGDDDDDGDIIPPPGVNIQATGDEDEDRDILPPPGVK